MRANSEGVHLLCSTYGNDAITVQVIDMQTGQGTGTHVIGLEDVIQPHGVLVDWLPSG